MSEIEKEQQDVVEFLEGNIPGIDSKTLEPYRTLCSQNGNFVCADNFDISEEIVEYYANRHFEIYSQQAREILSDLPSSVVLSSGMFGGKTTLSFIIFDELIKDGRKIELLIADVMGEDYITARSYKDGAKRFATRFGNLTNYHETIEKLSKSDVDFIFLDEFSFLDTYIVEELQEMCFDEGKKLILTGLNTSYLGQLLPAFAPESKIIKNSKVENCYSFVPGFCDDEPLGTSTIRYVKIGNRWVLDIGLLPLVVSKEKSHVVHYAPAMEEQTAVDIFKNDKDILDTILYPCEEKCKQQEDLLQMLSNS